MDTLEHPLKKAAKEKVEEIRLLAEKVYSRAFLKPTIDFNLSGTVAGRAWYGRNHISFNWQLLKENQETFLERTVRHEFSHICASIVYSTKIKPHGEEFRRVDRALGGDGSRCHKYDVSRARKGGSYVWKCACQEYTVGAILNNKLAAGQKRVCRKCKCPLTKGTGGAIQITQRCAPGASLF